MPKGAVMSRTAVSRRTSRVPSRNARTWCDGKASTAAGLLGAPSRSPSPSHRCDGRASTTARTAGSRAQHRASLIDQFEQCSLPRLELPARRGAPTRLSLTLTLTLTGRPPTLPQPSAQVWLIDEVLETKANPNLT